jgi:hypothetical protein
MTMKTMKTLLLIMTGVLLGSCETREQREERRVIEGLNWLLSLPVGEPLSAAEVRRHL